MDKTKNLIAVIVGLIIAVAGVILGVNNYVEKGNTTYAYCLLLAIIGLLILIVGIYNLVGKHDSRPVDAKVLAQAALCAALCYIGATFIKIQIPVPGTEGTMFHLGNTFCVLAALLIGGLWGGLAGAVGMTISDLTTQYVTSAPKTFVLKLCIGLIVGLVAHKIFNSNFAHRF